MRPDRCTICILLLLAASWAMAQTVNLTGTWNARTTSARGTARQTIALKQTGNAFAGHMITSRGIQEAIKNGKIKGREIEFDVERLGPGGQKTLVPYKGRVSGNSMGGTFTGASGRTVRWSAKRAS